jgi:hypothetical protein
METEVADSAGGLLNVSEDTEWCLIREVAEEKDCRVFDLHAVKIGSPFKRRKQWKWNRRA